MFQSTTLAAFAALMLATHSSAAGMYSKSSPVMQVDGKNFDKMVKNSDKSSVWIKAYRIAVLLR